MIRRGILPRAKTKRGNKNMSIFAGMKEQTSTRQSGSYLSEGAYNLDIKACKLVTSSKSDQQFFVVEAIVRETLTDEGGETSAGSLVSWVCKLGGRYPDSALRDIKAFCIAATGAREDEVDEQFVESVVEGEGSLLSGKAVAVTVEEKETKSGGIFSKHYWSESLSMF